MHKGLIVLFTILLFSCQEYPGMLQHLADLPFTMDENSGMVLGNDQTLWVIEDNGNPNDLYQIDLKGNRLRTVEIENAENGDWEDLAKDQAGNLYIADIGNNDNDRKDLVIYKIPDPNQLTGNKVQAARISFYYPEQHHFPPPKEARHYDAEALFHWGDHLYIVTKNRADPFDGTALLYKVPDRPGSYAATLVAEFITCYEGGRCQVTAADISADGSRVILLTYGRILSYTHFNTDDFTLGDKEEIELYAYAQLEAICFLDDSTVLVADELTMKGRGRNLYSYVLPEKAE
ncbi:hypothetical protein [Maribacter sp. 2307ULW6-5]|uniref:hypothetical protein n=1 Tax=Maribacter sp. 2307ULW6-5 TaxID=3386275 RepID=UPI0039BCC70D